VLLLKFSLEFLNQAEDVLNEHERDSYPTFLSPGTRAPGMIPYVSATPLSPWPVLIAVHSLPTAYKEQSIHKRCRKCVNRWKGKLSRGWKVFLLPVPS
jgi:hypothetical protein